MKDYFSLKLLDKLSFIFKKTGINYNILRRILQIKLTLDDRRVPTVLDNSENKEGKNTFLKSMLSYGIMGLIIMIFIIVSMPLFVKMTMTITIIMFMIMTTMIADFSSVLLDVRDKNIMLTKPIDERTLNTAKILHIFIYLSTITMVISGPSLIAGAIKYGGIFFAIFAIELILISGFIIVITALLYFFVLSIFDGEKLKDIINNFQIMLSITMALGGQLVGQMFRIFETDIIFTPSWWSYLLPPAWFAAPFEIIIEGNYETPHIILSLLSIVIPIVALAIYIKIIIPYFERNLLKLNASGSKGSRFKEAKDRIYRKLINILARDNIEKTYIRFTQNMLGNERKLKLKIYPSLAFGAILPIIIIFRSYGYSESFSEMLSEISNTNTYMMVYMTVFLLSSNISMLSTSENYRGAWIYKALPIKSPSSIYKGSIKGFILKYNILVMLFVSVIFLLIYGANILLDILVMFCNMILLVIINFKISDKALPFSKDFGYIKENGIAVFIVSIGSVGASVGLHWFLKSIDYGIIAYAIGIIIAIIVLWKRSFNISWEDIFYDEKYD